MSKEDILRKHLMKEAAGKVQRRKNTLWDSRLPENDSLPLEKLLTDLPDEKSAVTLRTWLEAANRNLLLAGDIGVGKTTLAIALAEESFERHKIIPMFVKYQSLFTLRLGKTEEDATTWRRALDCDLLVIDDIIAAGELSDWKHETLYDIFDYRYTQEKPIVITTNLVSGELKHILGERIIDRFRSTSVNVRINGESKR